MITSLIFFDAHGDVVGTLDYLVARDEDGNAVGLVDFEAYEDAHGRIREICEVATAVGGGTWPEWLGGQAHDFTVELDPAPGAARAKIARLIHKRSGHKRERKAVTAEIERRVSEARQRDEPADLRDLLGGPDRPLRLDEEGRTRPRGGSKPRRVFPIVPARNAVGMAVAHPRNNDLEETAEKVTGKDRDP